MAIIKHLFNTFQPTTVQDLTSVLGVAFMALVTYCLLQHITKLWKLPPGPYGLPVLGMLPKLNQEFHLFLYEYTKIFGKVFSCQIGLETCVILSDHKLIKKAFQSRDFTARPKTQFTKILGGYGELSLHTKIIFCSMFNMFKSYLNYLKNSEISLLIC